MTEMPPQLQPYGFTKDNQPANKGRKKSILGVLSELTGDNFKRELSREQKMEIIEVMTEKSSEELSEIYNNKANPIFIRMIANAIKSSIENGDVKVLETIWDRVYGKPAQSVNHGGQNGQNPLQQDISLKVEFVKAYDNQVT